MNGTSFNSASRIAICMRGGGRTIACATVSRWSMRSVMAIHRRDFRLCGEDFDVLTFGRFRKANHAANKPNPGMFTLTAVAAGPESIRLLNQNAVIHTRLPGG